MSFEQRHRRQVSSATDAIVRDAREDGKSEDFDKTIIHIQRKLDQIPPQYKKQSGEFNPLEQVIDMMKSTNLKERKKDLDTNVKTLDKAMESIVKTHYDGFNKAIKNYTQILSLVTSTGTNNATLAQSAAKCNALFTSRSHSVNSMYLQSLEYGYIIEILDKIEAIKKVPEQYQEAFNSQQYLLAATILVDSAEKLYQDDLLKIGALVELQTEIVAKKNAFHEVALELLHNLIYLKDSYDLNEESSSDGMSSSNMNPSSASGSSGSSSSSSASASNTAAGGANGSNSNLSSGEESRKGLSQIEAKDPLTIKLELMDQLVSSFFVLGKSSQAINKILERLRSEFRHIIQKAVATVKKRHESNPVLLQQILSRPPRGEHSKDYPNLFFDMLQIVFAKAKEVLVFHRCVAELFEIKLKEHTEAQHAAASDDHYGDGTMSGPGGIGKPSKRVKQLIGQTTSALTRPGGFGTAIPLNLDDDDSTSTTTYRVDHVWEEFQLELQALIGYYINAPADGPGKKTESTSAAPLKQGARLFSFSNSSAFTLYEVSETQAFQYRSMDMGVPSPYNLPSLYPLISSFCDLATQIVSARAPSTRLQDWMDGFISSNLLAVVRMDYKSRIDASVQSAEAFKSRDTKMVKSAYSADDTRRPLLNSAIEVYNCIKELYEDSVAMPKFTAQIHSIMEGCFMSYYEQCKSKYDEYVKDSEVGRTVKNAEFQKLLITDPQWKRILRLFRLGGLSASSAMTSSAGETPSITVTSSADQSLPAPSGIFSPSESLKLDNKSTRNALSSAPPTSGAGRTAMSTVIRNSGAPDGHGSAGAVDQEELEYIENLMDFEAAWHTGTTNAGVPIAPRHMILDPNRLCNLAALHDSCYWLADKVALLDRTGETASTRGKASGKSGSGGSANAPSLVSTGSGSNIPGSSVAGNAAPVPPNATAPRRMQRRDSKDLKAAASFCPRLSTQLNNLTWMVKDLSDQCLHNIYVDFRLQTCYYLDGISRTYVYAAEDRQPDARVVDLNTSFSNAFQLLHSFLPSAKLKYLLAGLPTLMSSLLIASLKSHIEAINRNGVVKMIRNIFALQQNLTGMTTFSEEPFDKARRYYELLNLNIEEVYQFISAHHRADDRGAYTLNQYRTILELIANPKNRTLTDEQEKDLRDKFVVLPYQAEAPSSGAPPSLRRTLN